jgi:perosamine synthetase
VSRFRYVAPAGAPIGVGDLLAWGGSLPAARGARARLEHEAARRFGVPHVQATSTGRAGVTLLLQALRAVAGGAGRDELIVPSYTCFSVAASAVKAGLKVRVADVRADTLDFDLDGLEALDTSRALAIVATNLYGLPNALTPLEAFARRRGIFVIDDAAQAMGATEGGRLAGARGDAGILSFDKGKNVSAIDGGLVLTAQPAIARALEALPRQPEVFSHVASGLVKLGAYVALLAPSRYWMVQRLPFGSLGQTPFTTDYPLGALSAPFAALAERMLPRLDAFTAARVAHARALAARLDGLPGLTAITPASGTTPVYLRYPMLAPDASTRDALVAALTAAGIGATASYPASLADVTPLQPHLAAPPLAVGGRDVAARILTLPTHPFVTDTDIARIAEVAASVLTRRTAGTPAATPASRPSTTAR